MRKVTLLLLLLSALLTSCITVENVKGDKPVKSEKRKTEPFERIRLWGSPTIYYAQADSMSVRVEAPEDLLEFVETSVKDSCLTVRVRDNIANILRVQRFVSADEIAVYVTSPDLVESSLMGSGDFVCSGLVDTDNLHIELKGAGDMSFENIICDRIDLSLVGSGDIKAGRVKALESHIELVGQGDMSVNLETVPHTDIVLKGSGDIKANFAECGNVVSSLFGSGDIRLSGDVETLEHSLVGSGDYSLDGLHIRK